MVATIPGKTPACAVGVQQRGYTATRTAKRAMGRGALVATISSPSPAAWTPLSIELVATIGSTAESIGGRRSALVATRSNGHAG
jgi:hypothetical protein